GAFFVAGAGADIWGTADAFQFVSQPLAGDGSIIARVNGEQPTSRYAKAGVMIRRTTDRASANVILDVNPGGNIEFMTRSTGGGGALPISWSHADVGAVAVAGNATQSGGTFNVSGAGADIWGSADAFHYAYTSHDSDGAIDARVVRLDNTNQFAKAGIMFRDS